MSRKLRILLSVILLMVVTVIFYQLSHTATDNETNTSSFHLSNRKHFMQINETLSILNKELQLMYRQQTQEIQSPNQVLNQMLPIELIDTATSTATSTAASTATRIPASVAELIEKHLFEMNSASPTLEKISLRIGIKDTKQRPKRRALLYTMDSISGYESASKQGGAAGEVIIRKSLEKIFKELNVVLDVKTTDKEFESTDASTYDMIILDPWTWAAKGWVPKKHIRGLDHKIYILDFFGSMKLRGSGLDIPPSRFLTAFPTNPNNTFLGYYMENKSKANNDIGIKKIRTYKGVLWGKDAKHFGGKDVLLKYLAESDEAELISTISKDKAIYKHPNIEWIGHQTANEWLNLLSRTKFLIGFGDPLLGPSALDAISVGCVFINPIYSEPVKVNGQLFTTQHPYAESIGEPYVCNYYPYRPRTLIECIVKAINVELEPYIPIEFTKDAYRKRVIKIFNL